MRARRQAPCRAARTRFTVRGRGGSSGGEEQPSPSLARPAAEDVLGDCLDDINRRRKTLLSAGLSTDGYLAPPPIEVAQRAHRSAGRPGPAGRGWRDRRWPLAVFPIATRQQPVEMPERQRAGQTAAPPAWHRWRRTSECWGVTSQMEEPQERTETDDAVLGRADATSLTGFDQELRDPHPIEASEVEPIRARYMRRRTGVRRSGTRPRSGRPSRTPDSGSRDIARAAGRAQPLSTADSPRVPAPTLDLAVGTPFSGVQLGEGRVSGSGPEDHADFTVGKGGSSGRVSQGKQLSLSSGVMRSTLPLVLAR